MTLECRTYATVDQIQEALKSRLSTIEGLRAFAYESTQSHVPQAYSRVVDWTYDEDFDHNTTWHFDIWIHVGNEPGLHNAHRWLGKYLSPVGRESIKCAIDADPTLNGTVSSARVMGGGAYGVTMDIGSVRTLAASVRLEVLA